MTHREGSLFDGNYFQWKAAQKEIMFPQRKDPSSDIAVGPTNLKSLAQEVVLVVENPILLPL